MKLLFDQNISFRIMRLLPDNFADCRHVRSVGLNDCIDGDIWLFAKQNGFTIVTFDADFFDMIALKGFPPKIVWLRTGNLSTSEIADCITSNYSNIASFINHPELNCLKIYKPPLLVALRAN
jgi:predicted nuclease of predicted toxin-antitoxin system